MPFLSNEAVSKIFVLPASDWAIINQRVQIIINLGNSSTKMENYIPSFPQMLAGCRLWQSTTFPTMVGLAKDLAALADTNVHAFTVMKKTLEIDMRDGSSLEDPLDPLGSDIDWWVKLISKQTTQMASDFKSNMTVLVNFMKVHQTFDAQLASVHDPAAKIAWPGGIDYSAFEQAAGQVTSGWGSVTDDLNNFLALKVNNSILFIKSLNVSVCITAWQNISVESNTFYTSMK